jgi:hypothetical protein
MKALFAIALLLPLPAWAAGPFDGTWKSQVDKAQMESKPMVQSLAGGRYKCVGCDANVTIDVKADGSDQPVTGTNDFDSAAAKAVDANTLKVVCKKNKQVALEAVDSVSPDGKTLTRNMSIHPLKGAPFNATLTFTRAGAAPAGAHATSGTWNVAKVSNVSDAALTVTYRGTADGMTMTAATGESYSAKFGGPEVPVKNDRAESTVSIKKINGTTFEETFKHAGKPVQINRITVDGGKLKVLSTDAQDNKLTLVMERIAK